MIANLYDLGDGVYGTVEELLKKLHIRVGTIVIGLTLLVLTMWMLNVNGLRELNFVFFFLSGAFLLYVGLAPRLATYSMVLGIVVAGLKDRDLSQGAMKGIEILFNLVVAAVFWTLVIAGFLATWSFEESPFAFIPLAAMSAIIAATYVYYKLKTGKIFMTLVILYAVMIIVGALYQTKQTLVEGIRNGAIEWWNTEEVDANPAAHSVSGCTVTECVEPTNTWSSWIIVDPVAGMSWVRGKSPAVLQIRVNGDDDTVEKWTNDYAPNYDIPMRYVQVRMLSGPPTMAYFGTPSEIDDLYDGF